MRRATALAICAQSPCMPARTNTWMHEQSENIMPPATTL